MGLESGRVAQRALGGIGRTGIKVTLKLNGNKLSSSSSAAAATITAAANAAAAAAATRTASCPAAIATPAPTTTPLDLPVAQPLSQFTSPADPPTSATYPVPAGGPHKSTPAQAAVTLPKSDGSRGGPPLSTAADVYPSCAPPTNKPTVTPSPAGVVIDASADGVGATVGGATAESSKAVAGVGTAAEASEQSLPGRSEAAAMSAVDPAVDAAVHIRESLAVLEPGKEAVTEGSGPRVSMMIGMQSDGLSGIQAPAEIKVRGLGGCSASDAGGLDAVGLAAAMQLQSDCCDPGPTPEKSA